MYNTHLFLCYCISKRYIKLTIDSTPYLNIKIYTGVQNIYHRYNRPGSLTASTMLDFKVLLGKSLRITEVITSEDCYIAVMLAGKSCRRTIFFLINHSCIHQVTANPIRELCLTCCCQFSPPCFLNGRSACNSDFVIDFYRDIINIAVPNLKMLLRVIQEYCGNCFKT